MTTEIFEDKVTQRGDNFSLCACDTFTLGSVQLLVADECRDSKPNPGGSIFSLQ